MSSSHRSKGAEAAHMEMARRMWTQKRLADEAGTNQMNISRVLGGKRDPSRALAAWFLREFGIPLTAWDEPSDNATGPGAA